MDWALQAGVMISVLILAILIIRRPFARMFGAEAAYALWALPLIRLFLPVIAIPQAWLPKGLRPQPEVTVDRIVPLTDIPVGGPAYFDRLPPVEGVSQSAASLTGLSILMGVWIGVAVSWFAYQLLQQRAFMTRMKAMSHNVDLSVREEGQSAAALTGLKALPELRMSQENIGPLVTGVVRPMVILPANFLQDYTADQRQYALIHEFAHIKRRDLWAAFAALIFRAMNWFNPLVHYAAHKMRTDQEAACDAFVMTCTRQTGGNRVNYAKTLLQAAKTVGASQATASLALSLTKGEANKIEEKETSE